MYSTVASCCGLESRSCTLSLRLPVIILNTPENNHGHGCTSLFPVDQGHLDIQSIQQHLRMRTSSFTSYFFLVAIVALAAANFSSAQPQSVTTSSMYKGKASRELLPKILGALSGFLAKSLGSIWGSGREKHSLFHPISTNVEHYV